MLSIHIFQTIVYILFFTFFSYLLFYLPGRVILHKCNIIDKSPEPFSLPIVIGVIIFILISYILSWVNGLPLLFIFYIIFLFIAIKNRLYKFQIQKPHSRLLLVLTGIAFIYSIPVLTTGIWGSLIHYGDDVIHLAYIRELVHEFPPENPGMAGIPLLGYHFFHDFLLSRIHGITRIPVEYLYFRISPLFTSFLLVYGIYSLMYNWLKKKSIALISIGFALFGGSFGYVLFFLGHTGISYNSIFGIDQPQTALLNPPYAFSLVLVIAGLRLCYQFLQTKKTNYLLLFSFVAGVTPMFKIYAGILLYALMISIVLIQLIKRQYSVLTYLMVAGIITYFTYGLFSASNTFLIWKPLWAPHSVLQFNLPWYGFEEKYYTYHQLNVLRGILKVEAYGLVLFVIGNLGTRLIGLLLILYFLVRKRLSIQYFYAHIAFLSGIALIIPLFFIQSIKVFEIIQFAWYYPFFCSLLAGVGFGILFNRITSRITKFVFILILIVFTIPSSLEIYSHFDYQSFIKNMIAPGTPVRSEVMTFLARDASYEHTVIEIPPMRPDPTIDSVKKWYSATNPYFSAYGNKRSYFHSQNIEFPNMSKEIEKRASVIVSLIQLQNLSKKEATYSSSLAKSIKDIKNANIRYIYSTYPLKMFENNESFSRVFNKNSTFLIEVR